VLRLAMQRQVNDAAPSVSATSSYKDGDGADSEAAATKERQRPAPEDPARLP